MLDIETEYYEQSDIWSKDFEKDFAERERLKEIINLIPSGVKSILDVGCGNGAFINRLFGKYQRIVGLDISQEALKHVKTEKILGSITQLPFEEKSFDLVTSLEVLEHLSQEDFQKGILELQRISKKYIILTVPNEENLKRSLVKCPKCNFWFYPFFHLRSFNKKELKKTFNNFSLREIKEIGPVTHSYPSFLIAFSHFLRKPLPLTTSICPRCGYQSKQIKEGGSFEKKNSLSDKIKSLIKIFFPRKKKPRWLLALYQRN